MTHKLKKFKKIVVLDSVIFYPEHRSILKQLADEIVEYPSSLPESLERQYVDNPEMFKDVRCYTELGKENSTSQLLQNRIEGADAVISCWTCIPDELLRLNPQLKLIVFWTHEKEHRLNVKLAEELGITVTNIPDYGTDAVAEVVFAGLLELLNKNYVEQRAPTTPNEVALSVMRELFRRYRQIDRNEKYTRAGKFVHHFHKLGKIIFSFEDKDLEQIIPEKLIARKSVALLGPSNWHELKRWLNTFEVNLDELAEIDANSATFYKTLARNNEIIFDSRALDQLLVAKVKALVPAERLIDIATLKALTYRTAGKTFGILGLGRIGFNVTRLAHQLGFNIQATTRKTIKDPAIKQVDLDTLLEQSDILSVHLPAHKAANLLDKSKLSKLKQGAIFINTADGNITDQKALTDLMQQKHLLAYLDVYPGLPQKNVLGLPMVSKTDWKLKDALAEHVLAYRAGWKTQESIRIKTYKLLGQLIDKLSQS